MNHALRSLALLVAVAATARATADDVSRPAMLQYFESRWTTIESRSVDLFHAGYGSVWLPPPGRAETGNQSVGYDVYDRFDLGGPGNSTLYGTEASLKAAVAGVQQFGGRVYTDLILNHNGFADKNTSGFAASGGYPGFALTTPGDSFGDFHNYTAGGDQQMRLSGLIDIAQEKNYQYVRNPVPGFSNNLPAGVTPWNGRLANVASEANRRFYPDQAQVVGYVDDPATGETHVPVYAFNTDNPMAGDPVAENATGYLMRQAQWMVQTIGVDGFRLDATKHYPSWVLNYMDRAVYNAKQTPLLDGSQQHVFMFGEYFDGNAAAIQQTIRKDINPATPNVVGGNRDALDFPLFFAMRDNLSQNGLVNDWRNVVNASLDGNDDGLANNGSQGVAFVSSHDEFGPYLSNVAYAYTLMRPGDALVYFNAKEFGDGRSFPKDGRGDALGGLYGDQITTLVEIRNSYGRGDYLPRSTTKEVLVYEREDAALVGLNNRGDNGFDTQTVQTAFAPGTPLVELTGNAANSIVDSTNAIDDVVFVQPDGSVTIKVPRNRNAAGVEHGRGYVIYGPQTPLGNLSLTNVVDTIEAGAPTAATNDTTVLHDVDVIQANTFNVMLQTAPVTLSNGFRDRAADGDNALLKISSGYDLNGNGAVDNVDPDDLVTYGFEEFDSLHMPGYADPNGNGLYLQTIDASLLPEGMNYIEARAFRQRETGEPALYSSFKRAVYIDRLPPESALDVFSALPIGSGEDRRVEVVSVDRTAERVHLLPDIGAALTDQQVLAFVDPSNQISKIDRDRFRGDLFNLASGNHALTVVTFESTGRYNVQRFAGQSISGPIGAGLGDLTFDGAYAPADVSAFQTVLYSQNLQFNPAGDLTADGRIDTADLFALEQRLLDVGANSSTLAAYADLVLHRGDVNLNGVTDAADIDFVFMLEGAPYWQTDLDSDGLTDFDDVVVLVEQILGTAFGDANLDGTVTGADYTIWADHFGTSGGWAQGDFTGDGQITGADFTVWADHFGQPTDLAAVPEPASWSLIVAAAAALAMLGRGPLRRTNRAVR